MKICQKIDISNWICQRLNTHPMDFFIEIGYLGVKYHKKMKKFMPPLFRPFLGPSEIAIFYEFRQISKSIFSWLHGISSNLILFSDNLGPKVSKKLITHMENLWHKEIIQSENPIFWKMSLFQTRIPDYARSWAEKPKCENIPGT